MGLRELETRGPALRALTLPEHIEGLESAVARYGTWKPIGSDFDHQPALVRHDLVILHTMVGSLEGTYEMFKGDGYVGVESHFGVGSDGTIWQFTDTAHTADANLDANDRAISVETADSGVGFPEWTGENVPAWTDDQVQALAELVAWACKTHGIPCVAVHTSLPSARGIGYHRLGINPWRVDGGESWSPSDGKICPGDRRVAQIPTVIAKANDILKGVQVPPPPPKPPGHYARELAVQHALGGAIHAVDAFKADFPEQHLFDEMVTRWRADWQVVSSAVKAG